ncbi:hypothetical protein M413DRAFT_21966 [Hebeloma cylindrosporum]|uniref:Uncharacterized protein n=1 Tax=Hebeloma cylindrosporum TaxID=76867 RepID=A0A0C3D126_HEBCY|nr:hypothetical protein M413DRAFT_21966 [Hebeloma cylindrosporum h7]
MRPPSLFFAGNPLACWYLRDDAGWDRRLVDLHLSSIASWVMLSTEHILLDPPLCMLTVEVRVGIEATTPTFPMDRENKEVNVRHVGVRQHLHSPEYDPTATRQSGMWKSYNDVDQQERGRTSSERLLTSVMTLKDPPLHPPRLVVPLGMSDTAVVNGETAHD